MIFKTSINRLNDYVDFETAFFQKLWPGNDREPWIETNVVHGNKTDGKHNFSGSKRLGNFRKEIFRKNGNFFALFTEKELFR